MKQFKLIFLVAALMMVISNVVWGQSTIYLHNFGTTTINTHPYTVAPVTFAANLSNSSWSNSTNVWTSYTGSTGQAISLSNSSGTPTITLTFNIAAGYQVSINSFNFWRQRSSSGAQNWSLTINGISVGSGTIPTTGAAIGVTSVSNTVLNQTGTLTVILSLSGASGSGTFRLDDFELIGTVTSAITPSIAITSPTISPANIKQGALDQVLMRYDLAVTSANATINGLTVTTEGSYIASDITNLKVRYSTDNVLDAGDATLSTYSDPGTSGTKVFPSFTNQTINTGNTGYIFVTADISSSATVGNTINIGTTSFSNISFSGSVNKTGTDPVAAGGIQTIQEALPLITINSSNPSVAAGNIYQNSNNNVIYSFDISVSKANATLSGLQITTAGSYLSSDLNNLKAWYSSDNSFNPASDVLLSTITSVSTAGVQVFPSWTNQVFTNGSTGYIFITADLPCSATYLNNISVNAVSITDLTFLSGDLSGTTYDSELQTFQYGTPNNITSPSINSPGSGQQTITWNNPSNCYDEILIVASLSTINQNPSGDGSSYSGNLTYGSGTSFGGGYVVYKGSSSPQTINGLTNGNTYYYKFFTRNGTAWSTGIETSSYLSIPISPGNIYISHLSADYNGSSDEFVVLFNNTDNTIDLNGYELKYFSAAGNSGSAGYTFSTSTLIQPRKHLLLSPNTLITVGSVLNKPRDLSFTSGLAASGQLVLRQTSNNSNVIFAVAWGTITGYIEGMTEAAPWPGDGMISLTPSGTTYIYNGGFDYSFSNTAYSHTLSVNITDIPNSGDFPLPIILSNLYSSVTGRNINLNWTTASETNNTGFEIERKTLNGTYSKVGFIQGHGTVNTPSNYTFEDRNLQTGKYKYRLKQIDVNGNYEYFNLNGEVEIGVPKKYDLSQNYPNPFNPVTKINFDLPVGSKVTMLIYDITGREVAKLLNGEFKKAGYYTTDFNASSLSSGVYFYSLSTDAFRMTKKMVVIK